mmetsp:Transcript_8752/g.11949  ORF Transcript_8752/g.11949 Transcript_8752/m.11949 type:complete len:287 (+) Transcript_8752:28-888(+)
MEDDGEMSISNWPILLGDETTLTTAKDLAWPAAEFAQIPSDIRLILRQGLALFHQETSTSNGSMKSSCPQLHLSLENILYSTTSDADSPLNESSKLAKFQLEKLRDLHPDRVVSPQQAAYLFMSNLQTFPKVNERIVDCMVRLFRWAMSEARHEIISHVLVNEPGEGFRVSQIQSCYIGIAFGSSTYTRTTEALLLQKPEIHGTNKKNLPQFVDSVYLSQEVKNDKNALKKHRSFLEKCGAQRGISLVLKSRSLFLREIKHATSKAIGDDFQPHSSCRTAGIASLW